ncbi:BrnA antitoxin family protein [Microcystis aeruginosa]|nr:BrnA antitoxin family protein [Microcystis aeruginosa]MDB9418038.1 BrnA antitoxin family protein [Microcystis aeruginosa CS-556/03]
MHDYLLEWFKSQGRGYQTQINQLLRAYMEAHQ